MATYRGKKKEMEKKSISYSNSNLNCIVVTIRQCCIQALHQRAGDFFLDILEGKELRGKNTKHTLVYALIKKKLKKN